MVRAATEAFGFHRSDRADRPLVTLGLTLGQRVEVVEFGGGEKHGGRIERRIRPCLPSWRQRGDGPPGAKASLFAYGIHFPGGWPHVPSLGAGYTGTHWVEEAR
jgi:hypothetical protein